MTPLTVAAFLVFLGPQEPCPKPCPSMDCMATFGDYSQMGDWLSPDEPKRPDQQQVVGANILTFSNQAALEMASTETWFGPRCDRGDNEATVDVLDVKAGRWFTITQVRETVKVQKPATVEEKRTGKLRRKVLP